mmetsp:Transcript_5376/g.16442  ORF Transcript_5376/g.16442 Transcript_5376/m.16442 type:complete len:762 (-) Transcript_5376:148-2433(-)
MAAFPDWRTIGAFTMVTVAGSSFAQLGRKVHMPLISGYIIAGAIAGPYVLRLLALDQVHTLKLVINSDAMGFIGFSAGTKFLLTELHGSLKPLLILLVNLILTTYTMVGTGFWLLSPLLPLTADYSAPKRLAVSLIVACLSVARSPSSAIAVITELGAHGAYTSATLSITVLTDIVVVLAFAGTTVAVTALVSNIPGHGPSEDPAVWRVLMLFAFQIAVSVIIGGMLGYIVHITLSLTSALASFVTAAADYATLAFATRATASTAATRRTRKSAGRWSRLRTAGLPHDVVETSKRIITPIALLVAVKIGMSLFESLLVQLAGFAVFEIADWQEQRYGSTLDVPLIVSLVAGFVVANFTTSRLVLNRILHDSSEPVYIAFFTLTGASLQLDALLPDLPAAVVIFIIRLLGIGVGSHLGGLMGGAEPGHRDRYWMALITQAGVTLGLLAQVTKLFPWAADLATAVTASVVLNQLVGPLLYKSAILSVGEAHSTYSPADGSRLGVPATTRPQPRSGLLVAEEDDPCARALRLRLEARGWHIVCCRAIGGASRGTNVPNVIEVEQSMEVGMIRGGRSLERERRFGQVLRVARRHSLTPPAPQRGRSVGVNKEPLLRKFKGIANPVEDLSLGEWELRVLWAISSLDSLDVLALLHTDDESNLMALRQLVRSASLLPHLHEWQAMMPQLVVRLCDPRRETDYVEACRPPFRLTLVSPSAAFPNLLAEMLHPDAHWSLNIDNSLPQVAPKESEETHQLLNRSSTGLLP